MAKKLIAVFCAIALVLGMIQIPPLRAEAHASESGDSDSVIQEQNENGYLGNFDELDPADGDDESDDSIPIVENDELDDLIPPVENDEMDDSIPTVENDELNEPNPTDAEDDTIVLEDGSLSSGIRTAFFSIAPTTVDVSNLELVWSPDFSTKTLTGSDEYISGNLGIQIGDQSTARMELNGSALHVIATNGNYKSINILTGTSVGGNEYYWSSNDGFAPQADLEYTVMFMASVSSGAGQVRVRGNSKLGSQWAETSLDTNPKEIMYPYIQSSTGGNLQIDTGSTPQGEALIITDLKIYVTPQTDDGTSGTVIYDMQEDTKLDDLNSSSYTDVLQKSGSATFAVSDSTGSKIISISNRQNAWDALDIKLNSLNLKAGCEYEFTITGKTNPSSINVLIGDSDSPYLSKTSKTSGTDGSFKLNFKKTYAELKAEPANYRIQTDDSGKTADIEITDIIITEIDTGAVEEPAEEIDDIVIHFDSESSEWNDKFKANGTDVSIQIANSASLGHGDDYVLKVTRELAIKPELSGWGHWVRLGHVAEHATPGDEQLGLPKNCKYIITAWFYVPVEAAQGKASISGSQIFLNNNAPASYPSNPGTITPGEWTKIEYETPVQTSNLDSISFKLNATTDSTYPTYWYIDDITIKQEITEPEEPGQWDLTLPSLKDTYAEYFDYFGNILCSVANGYDDISDLDALEMYKHHYNTVTHENLLKPSSIWQNYNDGPDYSRADRIIDWAEDNGISIVGHTLVWHAQSVAWVAGRPNNVLSRAEAKANMEEYINEVAGHYSGRFISWDVVNEVFLPGVNYYSGDWKSHLRTIANGGIGANDSTWYDAYANGADTSNGESGADYIYDAFVFARLADPNAKLYYNDFNDDQEGKSKAISAMVIELNNKWKNDPRYDQRLLIEGIGLQSHYDTVLMVPSSVEAAIERYIATGVEISISELDITINGTDATRVPTDDEYATQARLYAQLFEIYKKYSDHISRVSIWGKEDSRSWRYYNGMNGGSGGYPLLFDRKLEAKPAYYAVINPEDYAGTTDGESNVPTALAVKGSPTLGTNDVKWANASEINVTRQAVGAANARGKARLLWDSNFLYVRVEVTDNNIDTSSTNDYEKDSVEIFVSEEDFRGAYSSEQGNQYRITANGLPSFKTPVDGWTFSTTKENSECIYSEVTPDGYLVEMKIPIRGGATENQVIGFDVLINDPPPANGRPQITWSDPYAAGYNTSENWGKVTLVASLPVIPETPGNNSSGSSSNSSSGAPAPTPVQTLPVNSNGGGLSVNLTKSESGEYTGLIKTKDLSDALKKLEENPGSSLVINIGTDVSIELSKDLLESLLKGLNASEYFTLKVSLDENFKNEVEGEMADGGLSLLAPFYRIQFFITDANGEERLLSHDGSTPYNVVIPLGNNNSNNTYAGLHSKNGSTSDLNTRPVKIIEKDGKFFASITTYSNSYYSVASVESVNLPYLSGHWAKDLSEEAARRMWIDGENFLPDDNLTQKEFGELLTWALGIENTFKSDLTMSRGEMAVVLSIIAKKLNLYERPDKFALKDYWSEPIGIDHREAMAWAVENELIVGIDGKLNSNTKATNAQALAVIKKFLQLYDYID